MTFHPERDHKAFPRKYVLTVPNLNKPHHMISHVICSIRNTPYTLSKLACKRGSIVLMSSWCS